MAHEDIKKKWRPEAPAMAVDWVLYKCGCCQPDGYNSCPNPQCKNPQPPEDPRKFCKKP